MNEMIIEAFSDEITKIAFFQQARKGIVNLAREGWHGTPQQIAAGEGATWFGKGRQITPGMGPISRRIEEATSLGGATRALPVGSKSLMLLGTGLMANQAMRADPTGRDRSRTERLTGLAGNTAGGLVGAALGNRLSPGLAGNLVGGALGASIGEKVVTAPFAAFRQHRLGMQQQAQQAPQQAVPYQGAPA